MRKVKESATVEELARFLNAGFCGENVTITNVVSIEEAEAGHLTWAENQKALAKVLQTNASAVIVSEKLFSQIDGTAAIPCIIAENPRHAYARALAYFYERILPERGVDPRAVIGRNSTIGENVHIGPFAVVGDNTVIEKGATVFAHSYLGSNVRLGEDSIVYPFAVIQNNSVVGRRAIIHSGAVVGGDGFGFVEVGGTREKIPQVGRVELGDDVEIGANVTIDRATSGATVIGDGTKIDNLVQVGHNCRIGRNCILVSQSGIAGSTNLGDNVTFAAQAGAAPHITVGSNTLVAGRGGVTHDLPGNMVVSGFPAKPHKEALKINGAVQRLPALMKTVKEMEHRIKILEEKLEK